MANKILITGATGHIGKEIVEELIRRKIPVKVMVRSLQKNPYWEKGKVEQVIGDFGDIESLEKAFSGIDTLFSLTPFVENLVELGKNVVQAAQKARVRYIVRSSALTAGENATTIPRWHWQVEKFLEESGILYTIIRPTIFMQNYLRHSSYIKDKGAFYAPLGDGKVSYVDVRDIAAVAVAVLTEEGHAGKIYPVTGGEALSNYDIAGLFSKALGRTIKYVDIPESEAVYTMSKTGMPGSLVVGLSELNRIAKTGGFSKVYTTVEKLARRKPISFAQFISDNLGTFQTS